MQRISVRLPDATVDRLTEMLDALPVPAIGPAPTIADVLRVVVERGLSLDEHPEPSEVPIEPYMAPVRSLGELLVGDVIRHRGAWESLVVTANNGQRVTAIRNCTVPRNTGAWSTIEILRAVEWAGNALSPTCPYCRNSPSAEPGVSGHAPMCLLGSAIHQLVSEEPDVIEMARRMGFARTEGGWTCSRTPDVVLTNDELSGLYHERNPAAIRGLEAPGFKGRQPGERVETDSAATWVVSLGNVRRKGEPTVDEMAAEMGLVVCPLSSPVVPCWCTADSVSHYPPDDVRTLYREHKARQADPPDEELERALGRSVTKEEEPPTDPTALAEWLYARVVPGRTVVEHGRAYKVPVETVTLRSADVLVQTRHATLTIPGGDVKHVRLLNPDGTVLWEAK